MTPCIFCKIGAGEMPVDAVVETDRALAFADMNPQAPVHLIVIPKAHYADVADAAQEEILLGHLLAVATRAAQEKGLSPGGYRIVANTGPDAGQSVPHLHLHVLGGRVMNWPPG